jgi:hypothetical protein
VTFVLEVEREETFAMPGDGASLPVRRLRGSESMWASAGDLAPWLGYSDARALRAQIRNCGQAIAEYVAGIDSIPAGGAVAAPRTIAVYSEGAWELLAERGRTARARAVHALFRRAVLDELRLLRAATRGPLPYTRAVLALALRRLRAGAQELPEGSNERDLMDDVAGRLEEDRNLVELAKADALAGEAARARVAHRLPIGDVDPDPVRSEAARTHHHNRRMTWGTT